MISTPPLVAQDDLPPQAMQLVLDTEAMESVTFQ
jgi:hypothetical protein